MKKNFRRFCSLVVVFLIAVPFSMHAIEVRHSIGGKINVYFDRLKERTGLNRLIRLYKETQELRHKKSAGTASARELATLERRMRKIKKGAVILGVSLATIAALATEIGRASGRERV